ncbi:MAG: peptidase M75 [Prevotella sp.]|nr:peptidase M75 [Prevotella sp.]
MKKIFKYAMLFAAACTLSFGVAACGDDENEKPAGGVDTIDPEKAADLDYNDTYAAQWGNYMAVVSNLLKQDAQSLYDAWTGGYATLFKTHNSDEYPSALSCVEQILDGCIDIAGEVGDQKIGEPYRLYVDGKTTEALYAVESWYSWHSREDYRNNIYSIRNSYYGNIYDEDKSNYDVVDANSLSAVLAKVNPELDATAKAKIKAAADAIWAIQQPFRNNINTSATVAAMDACADLGDFIENELKPAFSDIDEATLSPVVTQYVDAVVLPTYKLLAERNAALDVAVNAFKANPSDAAFTACANAWLAARQPWESSEAFLFGPVDELGLDPNMDSWPLDQAQIAQILKSGDFSELTWKEGDSDQDIEDAQSLRGFHTLEFFIFKDGQPRKVK